MPLCCHIAFSFSALCHLSLKKVLLVIEVRACLSQFEHMCVWGEYSILMIMALDDHFPLYITFISQSLFLPSLWGVFHYRDILKHQKQVSLGCCRPFSYTQDNIHFNFKYHIYRRIYSNGSTFKCKIVLQLICG